MIEAVLEEGGFNKAVEVPAPVVQAPAPVPEPVVEETPAPAAAAPVTMVNGKAIKVVPGASPELIKQMQAQTMSKSALKRLRKKEAQSSGSEEVSEPEPAAPPAPVAAPAPVAPPAAPVAKVAPAAAPAKAVVAAPPKAMTPPPALESADEPIVFKPAVVVPLAAPAASSSSSSALAGFPLQISQLPSISISASKPAAAAPAPAAAAAPVSVPVAASQPPGLSQPSLSSSSVFSSSGLLPAAPGLTSSGPTQVSFSGFAMFGLGGLSGPPGMSQQQQQPVGSGLGVIGRTPSSNSVIPPRVNPAAAPAAGSSASYSSFEQPISGFDTIKIGNVEIPNISSSNGSSSYFPANSMIINEASNVSGLSANAPNFRTQQQQQQTFGGYAHDHQQQQLLQQQAQQQQQYQAQQYAAAAAQRQQQQQQQMNYGRSAQPQPVQTSWSSNASLQFNAKPSGLSPPGLFSQPTAAPAAPTPVAQPYTGNAWGQRAALAQQQHQQQQQANNMYANTAAAAAAANGQQQSRIL